MCIRDSSDTAEPGRGGNVGAVPPAYHRGPAGSPRAPPVPPPNFDRPSPAAAAGGGRRGAPASRGRGRGCRQGPQVLSSTRRCDLCHSAHCLETRLAFDSHMNRAHGVYRGRGRKYVRPCSPSPIRGATPGASAQAPQVTTGPPWAARPRPRVPETARAQPIPLMDLRFPNLGRGGPAPRAMQRPARWSPARPPTPNVMSVQAFPSLMGWRPRTGIPSRWAG